MTQPETARERTWRERREAKVAVASALADLEVAKDVVAAAQRRYWDALRAEDEAVRRNIEAWSDSKSNDLT